jgi:hypothetical protein
MKSKILVEHDDDYLLYIGNLEPAMEMVRRDRIVVERMDDGIYRVNFCDYEPEPKGTDSIEDAIWAVTAEYGSSAESEEEAWRYALAAYFGPLDEEYPGDEAWPALIPTD